MIFGFFSLCDLRPDSMVRHIIEYLNPSITLESVAEELAEIGYPEN